MSNFPALPSATEPAGGLDAVAAALEALAGGDADWAACRQLAAGFPIYYGDERWAELVVREWPDGRRELVEVPDDDSEPRVVRAL